MDTKDQFEHCRHNYEELEDMQARIAARVAGFAFLYMLKAIHGDYQPFRHHLMGDYDEDWGKYPKEIRSLCGGPNGRAKRIQGVNTFQSVCAPA